MPKPGDAVILDGMDMTVRAIKGPKIEVKPVLTPEYIAKESPAHAKRLLKALPQLRGNPTQLDFAVQKALEGTYYTAPVELLAVENPKLRPVDFKGFVTAYAKKDATENFAEMFAFYCTGDLPPSQSVLFEELVFDTKTAHVHRLARRFLMEPRLLGLVARVRVLGSAPMNNALDVPMPTYFAIECLGGETIADVVGLLVRTASEQKVMFRRVETLSRMELGKISLIRMRSDIAEPHLTLLLKDLHEAGRSVIVKAPAGFEALLPGRTGPVAGVKMMAVAVPTDRYLFKGSKIKGWDRQFPQAHWGAPAPAA